MRKVMDKSRENSTVAIWSKTPWTAKPGLPSGSDLHSHGIDGTFIDGLPNLKMVIFHGYVK